MIVFLKNNILVVSLQTFECFGMFSNVLKCSVCASTLSRSVVVLGQGAIESIFRAKQTNEHKQNNTQVGGGKRNKGK